MRASADCTTLRQRMSMNRQAILDAIPHRDPFLLVDEIVERTDSRIVGSKTFTRRGVVFCRPLSGLSAGAGRAAVRGGHAVRSNPALPSTCRNRQGKVPVATRMNDVRFKRIVRPGETIVMEVELTERLADAFFLKAKVTVDGRVAVRFEFACTTAEGNIVISCQSSEGAELKADN